MHHQCKDAHQQYLDWGELARYSQLRGDTKEQEVNDLQNGVLGAARRHEHGTRIGSATSGITASLIERIIQRLPPQFNGETNPISSETQYLGWYQQPSKVDPKDFNTADNATVLSDLLLEGAQSDPKVDVLFEIARQGRWKAAVWIAKCVLENSQLDVSKEERTKSLVIQSSLLPTFERLTDRSLNQHRRLALAQPTGQRLDINALLDDRPAAQKLRFNHAALGCVWKSLGMMTLACSQDKSIAGGFVKPEVLEILALFHHHGFMPESVYSYVPSDQPDAVQQPATLYMLSSRIMVALSDAAWRARETAALEVSGDFQSTRLERLGASVRANIEAVKPEMWLELILWSCIHGGWIEPGAEILVATAQQELNWRPISWRDTLKDFLGIESTRGVPWDKLMTDYDQSRRVRDEPQAMQLDNTISSELVNAFIEAITNATDRAGPVTLGKALLWIMHLRNFLRRSKLNLHGGTWDAIITRMVESNEEIVRQPDLLSKIVEIAPSMGEELSTTSKMPAYLLDANAALLGLLHRALRVQIDSGSLSGAITILNLIRRCVDDHRLRSVEDFFRSRMLDHEGAYPFDHFTNNFSGVEHPLFEPQISLSTIAALLDLIVQTGDLRFGFALIQTQDIGQRLLLKTDWGNPVLARSLIRFATASNNQQLLDTVVDLRNTFVRKTQLPEVTIRSLTCDLLVETFLTKAWDSARTLLDRLSAESNIVSAQCVADLVAVVIRLDADSADFAAAWHILATVLGQHSRESGIPAYANERLNIIKVMALADLRFAELVQELKLGSSIYCPSPSIMNTVLAAVADVHGSKQVRQILEQVLQPLDDFNDQTDEEDKRQNVSRAYDNDEPQEQEDLSEDILDAELADDLPIQISPAAELLAQDGATCYLRRPLAYSLPSFVIAVRQFMKELQPQNVQQLDETRNQNLRSAFEGMVSKQERQGVDGSAEVPNASSMQQRTEELPLLDNQELDEAQREYLRWAIKGMIIVQRQQGGNTSAVRQELLRLLTEAALLQHQDEVLGMLNEYD